MRYLQDMSKRAAAEPDAPLTFDMLLGIVLGMSRAKADPGAAEATAAAVSTLPVLLAQSDLTPHVILAMETDGRTLAGYIERPDDEGHLMALRAAAAHALADPDVAGIVKGMLDFFDKFTGWFKDIPGFSEAKETPVQPS
jgi:hypothetical protein